MTSLEEERRKRRRNLRNALLVAFVPFPSILFCYALFTRRCFTSGSWPWWQMACKWCTAHPLGLINVLFFLNVDVLFWTISLFQGSTWLIDPYWTILPIFMAHFFSLHPLSRSDWVRSQVVLILTWVWSIRLTHSYFRRENWQWGEREDWRFANMRMENPKHWWWVSFFVVYLSQHCFLVGICLPFYTIHNSQKPWSGFDLLVTLVCFLGIIIGYVADTQLHQFVMKNKLLNDLGISSTAVLDEGLWHYSRHPNYFGEQLWWWGLAGYSWIVGQGWATVGTVINSLVLAYVTVLVEKRMLSDLSRREAYRQYQQTTSVWILWLKKGRNYPKVKSI